MGKRLKQTVADLQSEIADRKQVEKALRESESRLYTLINHLPGGILLETPDRKVQQINQKFCDLFAIPAAPEALLGVDCRQSAEVAKALFQDEEAFPKRIDQILTEGEKVLEEELSLIDGRIFQRDYIPIQTDDGRVEHLWHYQDITARKREEQIMQARLRLTESADSYSLLELLQATIDEAEALTNSAIGFYHFLEADQKTLSLQAWSTHTIEEMCQAEGEPRHYPVEQAGVWVDCIHARQPIIHNDYASLPHRKGMPIGHADVIRELVVPVKRGEQITAVLGVGNKKQNYDETDIDVVTRLADLAWDIVEHKRAEESLRASNHRLEATLTELKETQEKVVQQERLAAVGQLAAGIAHDFNNILTSILGYAELLRLSAETPEPMRTDLDTIIASAQRGANLVRQILDFSRKSIRQPQELDLAPFIKEAMNFLAHIIPENIHTTLEIKPDQYLVEADPTQLQQILTNLSVNAKDAMPNGGQLKVTLSRLDIQDPLICAGCDELIQGVWIQLQVTDTGEGIPPEVIPHIFEPFFTTKEVGEGTGLGLSQVYGIVVQHNGHITVDSQVGQGAKFTIYLPPASVNQIIPAPEETVLISSNQNDTILLIEDEPTVLETTKIMLKYLGYEVLTASNGQEALDLYSKGSEKITLVLSDMVMPDMDGEILFEALKNQNAGVKVLFMSGYPLGEKGVALLEQGAVDWFQKPVSLSHLSQRLSQALNAG